MTPQEQLAAPWLELILSWILLPVPGNPGVVGPGDPHYLTDQEATELAAAGIRALSSYLPSEEAGKVESAVRGIEMKRMASAEQMLVAIGASLGDLQPVVVSGPDPNSAPGCCVRIQGRWQCVRVRAAVPELGDGGYPYAPGDRPDR
jgi:hypothetical protein